MTLPRQTQKRRPAISAFALGCGLLCLFSAAALAAEPVSVDPQNGLAISGFDPVAYFTEASAEAGRPEVEITHERVTWRFRNEGNRAAFTLHPDVYSPRFGGYDPVAIARGASVPGHPLFWLVSGQRLYLFYSADARTAFAADPDRVIEAAERKWPEVKRTLP